MWFEQILMGIFIIGVFVLAWTVFDYTRFLVRDSRDYAQERRETLAEIEAHELDLQAAFSAVLVQREICSPNDARELSQTAATDHKRKFDH